LIQENNTFCESRNTASIITACVGSLAWCWTFYFIFLVYENLCHKMDKGSM